MSLPVECSQGSFYNEEESSCALCSKGHYQPYPKQSSCIRCPKGYTTYGRGAVFDIECCKSCDDLSFELRKSRLSIMYSYTSLATFMSFLDTQMHNVLNQICQRD